MQPNHSKTTSVRCYLQRATAYASAGILLSFAGCMGPADTEQVDPGQTSSELGIGPGPGITPAGSKPSAAALSTILLPTAGAPAIPNSAPCASDNDCRVERSDCSQCACHALGATQKMSACYGEKVTCVLDPCAETTARCIAGHCSAESENVR